MSQQPASIAPLTHKRQPTGRKAQRTRNRLVDATVASLEARSLREISVAEIARAAETSPATFYGYFRDISEAVLAALDDRGQSTPDMLAIVDRKWSSADAAALAFVETYCTHWTRAAALYRCRNLASEEGDPRFVEARARSVAPLLDALAIQVEHGQLAERVPSKLKPRATASAIVILLERLAAVRPGYDTTMLDQFEQIKAASVYMIICALGFGASEPR